MSCASLKGSEGTKASSAEAAKDGSHKVQTVMVIRTWKATLVASQVNECKLVQTSNKCIATSNKGINTWLKSNSRLKSFLSALWLQEGKKHRRRPWSK